MRRLAVTAVVLVWFAAAAPAAAKEVTSVTVCDAYDCITSTAPGLLRAMIDIGPPADPPNEPAAFYTVTIAIGDGQRILDRHDVSWVPSAARLQGSDGTWMAVRPEVRDGLDRLTADLVAKPGGRLPESSSGGADVAVTQILPGLAVIAILALALVLARRELRGRWRGQPVTRR
jgi:hypothetical protein